MEADPDLAAEHASLLQFLYNCPHGLAQFDASGTISMLNPAFACLAMPLLPAGETFGNLIDLLKPCLPDLLNLLEGSVARGTLCDGVRVHLGPAAPGQDPRVLSLTVVRMDKDRQMAVLSDLTRQVAQERRLKENEAWFAALVQGADDYAILNVDGDGRVCDWNVSGKRLFGYVSAEIVGKHASEVVTSGKPNAAAFGDRLREASRDGWHLDEGWRRRADGGRFWGTCMVLPINIATEDASMSARRYLMVVRDVTKRRHSAEELRRLLTEDHLTGVLNRHCFLERAERELSRQVRHGGRCCIAMVDADHFKAVNDTHGHAAGDAALRAIADVLQTETHVDDLVGRLGGEEFAVLMPATTPELAEQVAERLRAGVAALRLEHEGQAILLTVSVGIAEGSTADLKQLLRDADAALYDAKHSGRNRVCRSSRALPSIKPAKPLAFAVAAV
jgi:diguanylate cyclase (GGDEF)-like protein/PAS domain S-box-containing protein